MLFIYLFVSYAHANLCQFFSSPWCQWLVATSAYGSSWTFLFTFIFYKQFVLSTNVCSYSHENIWTKETQWYLIKVYTVCIKSNNSCKKENKIPQRFIHGHKMYLSNLKGSQNPLIIVVLNRTDRQIEFRRQNTYYKHLLILMEL